MSISPEIELGQELDADIDSDHSSGHDLEECSVLKRPLTPSVPNDSMHSAANDEVTSSIVFHDDATEDTSQQPMWKNMQRATPDLPPSPSQTLPRTPVRPRKMTRDVAVQVVNSISYDGTIELLRNLQQETEDEVEFLEQRVQVLTAEQEKLRHQNEASSAALLALTAKKKQWERREQQLNSRIASLQQEALQSQPIVTEVHSDIQQILAILQQMKLPASSEHDRSRNDLIPQAVEAQFASLFDSNRALREQVDSLRRQTTTQQAEILLLIKLMRKERRAEASFEARGERMVRDADAELLDSSSTWSSASSTPRKPAAPSSVLPPVDIPQGSESTSHSQTPRSEVIQK